MQFKRSKSTLEYPPYSRFQPQAFGQSTWLEITHIYNQIVRDPEQRARLSELMIRSGMGSNPDALGTKMYHADPLRTLRQYQRVNPRINLSKLVAEVPYEVMAGLVYSFSAD